MVSGTKKGNNNNSLNKSSEESFDKLGKDIETYSTIALFCLIAAILLITFDYKLLAGCMIISGASLGLITVRKSATLNKIFKQSLNEFSSLNEKKDDFIKDLSHKIREPLNNLVLIVDMIMESGLRKEQKELLETFIASMNNMVTTVNELTMQSAGNLSYENRKGIRFNLISTLQNTIELYSLKDKANIDFILNKKGFSDFECFGDPIILKQIFLDLFNTIENSISERATKVTINLKKEKDAGNESIISFRIQTDRNIVLIDNTGVEQSQASRLILTRKGTFSQEVGANSTILNILLPFTNPVSKPDQKTASPKFIELILKDKVHKELKDIKILLVEDNLINQKITFLTLKSLVNSIDTALNGKEALDKFGTTNYDLILMDIQMPLMNGLVATEKIRALESTTNSHIPIIAITANAMIGDKEKCLSAGIDDYLSKPFQPSALIEIIRKNI
ncbi:MAG: response regulator [Bacteroidota bacterium]